MNKKKRKKEKKNIIPEKFLQAAETKTILFKNIS